jgi:hypothetical protein
MPITALHRYYGRSDSCLLGSLVLSHLFSAHSRKQVSLIHTLDLPTIPPPPTLRSLNAAFSRYPSAR